MLLFLSQLNFALPSRSRDHHQVKKCHENLTSIAQEHEPKPASKAPTPPQPEAAFTTAQYKTPRLNSVSCSYSTLVPSPSLLIWGFEEAAGDRQWPARLTPRCVLARYFMHIALPKTRRAAPRGALSFRLLGKSPSSRAELLGVIGTAASRLLLPECSAPLGVFVQSAFLLKDWPVIVYSFCTRM